MGDEEGHGPGEHVKAAFLESNEHFEANREAFVRDHHRSYVLIHGRTIVGFFEDRGLAYLRGKKDFPGEVFLIRRCLRKEEEERAIFRSRVA